MRFVAIKPLPANRPPVEEFKSLSERPPASDEELNRASANF
jgi:hypothetical protein